MAAPQALPEAFHLNEDGSAVDPAAFVAALRADPEKLAAIEQDPELKAVILGSADDGHAGLQELLKSVFKEEKSRMERRQQRMSERSVDAQRASATVPRDTVQLYQQLHQAGLSYGPAFRLLRNVHVPDTSSTA